MMRNLLILCADSRMINGQPFITTQYPDGRIIAEKVIEGICPKSYDRIYYVVLEEVDKKYQIRERIRTGIGYKYPITVLSLPHRTNGPAETAYQAIKAADIEGELAIRDSHCYIQIQNTFSGNCIAGLNLTNYGETIDNLRTKSFIIPNEQKQVLDIIEKHFCSDVISCGFYGFKNAQDFLTAYERLSDSNYPIQKLYISHIISYLIGYSQRVFHAVEVTTFEDWSTPKSWREVQRWHATYFLDLDAFESTDIPFNQDILRKLQELSENGCCIVAFTTKKQGETEELLTYMRMNAINVLQIVGECSFSAYKGIIDSKAYLDALVMGDNT